MDQATNRPDSQGFKIDDRSPSIYGKLDIIGTHTDLHVDEQTSKEENRDEARIHYLHAHAMIQQ